jgi:hypothetical protein
MSENIWTFSIESMKVSERILIWRPGGRLENIPPSSKIIFVGYERR